MNTKHRMLAALATLLLGGSIAAAAESPDAAKLAAAWPKGSYASLDRLPDWVVCGYLRADVRRRRASAEQPNSRAST